MRVPRIDENLCQGCGNCEAICPEVFEVREDGLSHIITTDISDLEGCIEAAVENCPEDAISFEEQEE